MQDAPALSATGSNNPAEETTAKKTGRCAVEPVETTIRSHEKQLDNPHNGEVESTLREQKAAKQPFLEEPVETTFKSSKDNTRQLPTPPLTSPESFQSSQSTPNTVTPKPRKRFEPQLIETSERSKKAGSRGPAVLPTDKTDITPGTNHIYVKRERKLLNPQLSPAPLANSPRNSYTEPRPHISYIAPRRQGSMKPHLNTRSNTRQDAYQPTLEPIVSGESSVSVHTGNQDTGESTPSLSASIDSSNDSVAKIHMTRTRESNNKEFSGYLLSIAANTAEKQLKEQALAAFPNESMHEIVEHFYNRDDNDCTEEDKGQDMGQVKNVRQDSTGASWAAREMQEHQEKLKHLREETCQREEATNAKLAKLAKEANSPQFPDPFWTNGMTEKMSVFARAGIDENNNPPDLYRETELEKMRNAASPPMLGSDLKFRMCPSPKATKFESDQPINVAPHRSETGGGLWGGYCIAEQVGEYVSPSMQRGPTMIHTPCGEREDPLSSPSTIASTCHTPGPRTPSRKKSGGVHMLTGLDERLKAEAARSKAEEALLEEFRDTFVTQVYNYLSLGYPSLARPYDEELAKISHVSEEELRSDDQKQDAKGHIGLVQVDELVGDDCDGEEILPGGIKETKMAKKEGHGARWKALRIYILEWARQHPGSLGGDDGESAWGVRARRGSWAI